VAGGNERGGISRKVSRQRDEADEVERIGEERMHCAGKQQGTAGTAHHARILELLQRLLHPGISIAESARWALSRIQ